MITTKINSVGIAKLSWAITGGGLRTAPTPFPRVDQRPMSVSAPWLPPGADLAHAPHHDMVHLNDNSPKRPAEGPPWPLRTQHYGALPRFLDRTSAAPGGNSSLPLLACGGLAALAAAPYRMDASRH
jgi:hypothetical protein